MSVTSWALSGEPLKEAVVSTKTGHVFERSVIEKHIQQTGQCPITGVDLELKDLLPLKGKIFYFLFVHSFQLFITRNDLTEYKLSAAFSLWKLNMQKYIN